jgi:hypothetical protein
MIAALERRRLWRRWLTSNVAFTFVLSKITCADKTLRIFSIHPVKTQKEKNSAR